MIGDAIRQERERRGWSQRELALETKLGQSYISKIEANLHPRPSWDVLRRIARAFDLGLDELLRRGGLLDAPPVDSLLAAGRPQSELLELQRIWARLPDSDRALLLRMAGALEQANLVARRTSLEPQQPEAVAQHDDPASQQRPEETHGDNAGT